MAGQSSQRPCCFHGVQALWVVYINLSVQLRADKWRLKVNAHIYMIWVCDMLIMRLTIFYCTSDFYTFFPIWLQKEQWSLIHYRPCQAQKNLFFSNKGDFINHSFCKVNITKALSVFFITFEGQRVLTLREACVI